MIDWKDATSYSRDERRGTKPPDAFSANVGPVRLWIGTGHIYYKGQWVASAFPFFEARPINATNADEAKREAVALASKWLTDCLEAFAKAAVSEPHEKDSAHG